MKTKTYVITGSASGIGKEVIINLAKKMLYLPGIEILYMKKI